MDSAGALQRKDCVDARQRFPGPESELGLKWEMSLKI